MNGGTLIVHHQEILRRLKAKYSPEDVHGILSFLNAHGALRFAPLPTGLFPAAGLDPAAAAQSGYGNVWVRDNVYIAFAHEKAGRLDSAVAVVTALSRFYGKYCQRFKDIVAGLADPNIVMNRPHVRFDGLNLAENHEPWAHAQNDALGYFLWIYCRLARRGLLAPDGGLLALFALYFERIRYWQDEDSGHWEEERKVEASSIGPVVAGLRQLRELLIAKPGMARRSGSRLVTAEFVGELITAGEAALASLLPSESAGPKARRYDAALLFLIYPLEVVDDGMAGRIVHDVTAHLQGDYGIRRYLGDSYWTADYKDKLPPQKRTADVSEDQSGRDALARPGEEAQWCIFDPIVSIIAGRRYLRTQEPADLEQQACHLNRSLGQITGPDCPQGELLCPEAYYLEHGRYVPNDHLPLLWTEANLWMALLAMGESAKLTG